MSGTDPILLLAHHVHNVRDPIPLLRRIKYDLLTMTDPIPLLTIPVVHFCPTFGAVFAGVFDLVFDLG